jgi:hypothetical protein
MTTQKFLDTLVKYYYGPIRGSYAYCKFYLQASTFSYEIHDSREFCFTNDSLVYESDVFFWGTPQENKTILKEIRKMAKNKLPKNLEVEKLFAKFAK